MASLTMMLVLMMTMMLLMLMLWPQGVITGVTQVGRSFLHFEHHLKKERGLRRKKHSGAILRSPSWSQCVRKNPLMTITHAVQKEFYRCGGGMLKPLSKWVLLVKISIFKDKITTSTNLPFFEINSWHGASVCLRGVELLFGKIPFEHTASKLLGLP